jgi:hypothetical protein
VEVKYGDRIIINDNPDHIAKVEHVDTTISSVKGFLLIFESGLFGWEFEDKHYNVFGIPKTRTELLGKMCYYTFETHILRKVESGMVAKSSGCRCKKCKTYNEYAESNQEDGSFICYSCRR